MRTLKQTHLKFGSIFFSLRKLHGKMSHTKYWQLCSEPNTWMFKCTKVWVLTHLPLVPHIYASCLFGTKPLSKTNAALLSIRPFGTNCSGILIKIQNFSFTHGLTLIPAWICNHKPGKVWDKITYPFRNFNGFTIEVWKWIIWNFIPHFIMDVIILLHAVIEVNPCWRNVHSKLQNWVDIHP